MGYTTSFHGVIKFDRELTLGEYRELEDLAEYEPETYKKYSDKTPDNGYNQWEPTKDGWGLQWNGSEKFYDYVEWLQWLIDYFFKPHKIMLNGIFTYQGEEIGDVGRIEVKDNVVKQVKLDIEGAVECPKCGNVFKPE
jgi:hypothetical protein